MPQRQPLIVTLGKALTYGVRGGRDPDMPPIAPRLVSAKHGPLTRPAPLVGMPSSQVRPLAQGPLSLVKGSRASGSADEVLVIALAALTYEKRCGGDDGHGRSLEDLMQAVEGFSHGYVEGNVWRTPLFWTGKDEWIVAYLKGICRVSANEVASTLSVARSGGERARRRPVRQHPRARARVGEEISRAAKRLRKEQSVTAGLHARMGSFFSPGPGGRRRYIGDVEGSIPLPGPPRWGSRPPRALRGIGLERSRPARAVRRKRAVAAVVAAAATSPTDDARGDALICPTSLCAAHAASSRASFVSISPVFCSPRARPARALCCGRGARPIARSLDRAHAVWRWR